MEYAPTFIAGQTWGCLGTSAFGMTLTEDGVLGVPSGQESADMIQDAINRNACVAPAAMAAFSYGPLVAAVSADDWYLPSTIELNAIRDSDNPNVVLEFGDGVAYWSSTEQTAQNAFLILESGIPSSASKESVARVLPVRSF
jgi:hypothetical protein